MSEQPHSPPLRLGLITANETTGQISAGGAVSPGDDVIVNEYDIPDPNNFILIPSANASVVNWTGSASSIDDSPWLDDLNVNDVISCSTPNATARFQLTDLPSTAQSNDPVLSVVIGILARRTGGGSLNLAAIQIVNANDTAELTDPTSMSLGSDWAFSTFRQPIIGQPSKTQWNAATLKLKTDGGSGGTVEVASVAVRVKYRFQNASPFPQLKNVYRTVHNRFEETLIGRQCYYHEFPWGFEMVRAEPTS